MEKTKTDSIIPPPSHDEYMSCVLCDTSGKATRITSCKLISKLIVNLFDRNTDDPTDPMLLQKLNSSDIVFLLHDASRPNTLESIKRTWLPLVRSAFGDDRTKSAVIIRTKNDLFPGVSDFKFNDTGGSVAVSQDGGGAGDKKNEVNEESMPNFEHSDSDSMAFSYMGVEITHPDKFSPEELEIGKSCSFISALSM